MNLKEIIDDTLISYSKRVIDLEQARDIILMEINTLLKKIKFYEDVLQKNTGVKNGK